MAAEGGSNRASDSFATVCGGSQNSASGSNAFIGGGNFHLANGNFSALQPFQAARLFLISGGSLCPTAVSSPSAGATPRGRTSTRWRWRPASCAI
jgi:hypothetical protein